MEQWLLTAQIIRGAGWAYSDPFKNVSRMNVYEGGEDILFVAESRRRIRPRTRRTSCCGARAPFFENTEAGKLTTFVAHAMNADGI